ncbi:MULTISPECIES: hypothetical protein [unclassified Caballeronia]|uniref:hypothetical protein n=1 Tax=unclassified Caballeronia TaxID=2646786 RepID=UPI0020291DAB|nr:MULTISPECIES: hypothetical protein [unclassified Caballeronia]MDR5763808.1 hypothetical protein [Caballeronia sp. LZ028]
MLRIIFTSLLPYLVAAVVCIVGTIALYQCAPRVLDLLSTLLVVHPLSAGTFTVLAVASVDSRVLQAGRYVRFQNVGAKSAAQLLLGDR